MNKGTAIVGFLLCFLAGMGLMWGVEKGRGGKTDATAAVDNPAEWSDEGASVPISSKDPMWGSRSAPVTLVIFSDYECPFCSKVEATFEQIKEKYGPQQVRLIWKENPLPFHKNARPAALAGQTVFKLGGNDAFWKFHKIAFENQKALTPENFESWAGQAGVDKAKFKASFDKQEFAAKIDADMAVGKPVGVRGTPATFVNGIFLSGAQPLAKFTEIIDQQLAAAKTAGVPADKVYVKLSNDNKAKNPTPADPAAAKDGQKPAEDDKTVWKVKLDADDIVKGPQDALVTVVEFSDFECPFCSRVVPTMDQVLKDYDGKVRFIFKHRPLPMHPRATPASTLALEAGAQKGPDAFWKAYDLIWKKLDAVRAANKDWKPDPNDPKKRRPSGLEDEDLLAYAKELGLDEAKVKAAIADNKFKDVIDGDSAQADDLEAQGTPHFFINGRRLVGAQPIEKFKTVIDEEIKKGEELIKGGVAKKDLYAKIIENGKEPPPPEKKDLGAVPADAPWKGNEKAKVVMQIVSDFQCPFCKRVEPTFTQIEKEFGDRIKIVWRDLPLPMHPEAPLAAEAAREAFKQKKGEGFWKYHDALMAAQGSGPDALKRPALEKIAEEQGLDMAAFKKALDTNVHKAAVDADKKQANDAGIQGTPAAVINGYFINGAQPYGKFKKAIQLALAEAEGGKKPADKPAAPRPVAPQPQ